MIKKVLIDYDDDKRAFVPTLEQITLINKTAFLKGRFNKFKGNVTPIEDIYHLIKECKETYEELYVNYKYRSKFSKELFELYYLNKFILDAIVFNNIAIEAMEKFYKLDVLNERALVKWLLKYDKISSIDNFKKLNNWKINHLLVLQKYETIVLDCSNYMSLFQFSEVHFKNKINVMLNYLPTADHYDIAKTHQIVHSLESLLTWHQKYLDLLPSNVKIMNDWEDTNFPLL